MGVRRRPTDRWNPVRSRVARQANLGVAAVLRRGLALALALAVTLPHSVAAAAPGPDPQTDAPKADAPKADAPKADAPKANAPKADAPKANAPKADAPKADAPKADAPTDASGEDRSTGTPTEDGVADVASPTPSPSPDGPTPDALTPDTPTPNASTPNASTPTGAAQDTTADKPVATKRIVAPVVARTDALTVRVAVGLAPDAPGTKRERSLLDALERSADASRSPATTVRRLPLGSGHARRVCRERRDDLVILIGYVPSREAPAVLAHDCRLDTPLSVRAGAAASQVGLVGALWREHAALVRSGVRERRTVAKLSVRARGGIIAGVAIAVVGGAIAILVASALRKEQVVLTVRP